MTKCKKYIPNPNSTQYCGNSMYTFTLNQMNGGKLFWGEKCQEVCEYLIWEVESKREGKKMD